MDKVLMSKNLGDPILQRPIRRIYQEARVAQISMKIHSEHGDVGRGYVDRAVGMLVL